jgi:NADH-quinone oxidoreductase subunit L
LLIPFFPLASALLAGFGGRFIGAQNAAIATTTLLVLTFFTAFSCFLNIGLSGESVTITLCDWITCGLLEVHWGFLFDPLSISTICVVTGVSSLVHI